MIRPFLDLEAELLKLGQDQRFFMLAFDAGIEQEPVIATRDFLTEWANSLRVHSGILPDALMVMLLEKIDSEGFALKWDQISAISDALEKPNEFVIEAARILLLDHLAFSSSPPSDCKDAFAKLLAAMREPKKKGRKPDANKVRDRIIAYAVHRLLVAGLTKVGAEQSACQIVSDELCRMGHPLSTDGVRKVYDADESEQEQEEACLSVAIQELYERHSNDEHIQQLSEAWETLEAYGKKLGYIPSND